jgi:hypothetical protein
MRQPNIGEEKKRKDMSDEKKCIFFLLVASLTF